METPYSLRIEHGAGMIIYTLIDRGVLRATMAVCEADENLGMLTTNNPVNYFSDAPQLPEHTAQAVCPRQWGYHPNYPHVTGVLKAALITHLEELAIKATCTIQSSVVKRILPTSNESTLRPIGN